MYAKSPVAQTIQGRTREPLANRLCLNVCRSSSRNGGRTPIPAGEITHPAAGIVNASRKLAELHDCVVISFTLHHKPR